jgi:guanidinopropionase
MNRFFQPISGLDTPRFAGMSTFMRLPHVPPGHEHWSELDFGYVGVPWDGGTTNRPGARHGPRQVRDSSSMIRSVHPIRRRSPYADHNCADLGDAPVNPADLDDSLKRVEAFYRMLSRDGIVPITAGGDHLIALPILRGLVRGPVGMIQFDSHTDLYQGYFGGYRYTHGTPFRRAVEEGLLDPRRTVQIGLRGSMYDTEDIDFGQAQGVRMIMVEELMERGVAEVMQEARSIVGTDPIYVSFDIDFVDPAYAPGTGTPEIGGPTSFQALQAVRGLMGTNIIGADMVEVSPPFDPSGGTALIGATVMFELLCAMTTGEVQP